MDDFATKITAAGFTIQETIVLHPRPERRANLPNYYENISNDLIALTQSADLWSHQAAALRLTSERRNVVIATGTASGKSLIFQLRALNLIRSNPENRILVFYPLKALSADQHESWKRLISAAELSPSSLARIDGDTSPGERFEQLEHANVVLMTPDVCQAWLMRNVAHPVIRKWLGKLALLVLDEAHVYESVFGSNVAFLLRRLTAARQRVAQSRSPLQIIAATATIAYAREHLCELTGLDFEVVGDDQNGAPAHERHLYHVISPDRGEPAESALAELLDELLKIESSSGDRVIAFHDSRQGVERIVKNLEGHNVLPYRSGYEAADREKIERALRSGKLAGVVSTSALELGIDIADMTVGVNLGVPQSRKSFRQRLGRVGRSKPGYFIVFASVTAFRRYGETFEGYFEGSIEPSYLYLGNRFIQFAHARCLADEIEVLGGGPLKPPVGVLWPEGFEQILRLAGPGTARPKEFDLIAQLGADNPHFNYPLRNVGEASLDIKFQRDNSDRLGSIAMNQAIREAYPGATYLHMGRAYKVAEWNNRSFERCIRVFPAEKGGAPTKPISRTCVNLSLEHDSIVEGHLLRADTGLVAEVHLHVTESVEGYRIGGTQHFYRDLRAQNPAMSRKQRDFRTTGIVVKIEEDWFSGSSPVATRARKLVAEGLLQLLLRERSIAPQDIDATHTNIAVLTEAGPKRATDAVVIYDAVYGGLRLTEDLFLEFQSYVDQLCKAAQMAGEDALVPPEVADPLHDWAQDLEEAGALPTLNFEAPDGWQQVYKPGSEVGIYFNGTLLSIELGQPSLLPFGDSSMLVYCYERGGAKHMIPHAQVQSVGQEWQWALWNPETGEVRDIDEPGVLSAD